MFIRKKEHKYGKENGAKKGIIITITALLVLLVALVVLYYNDAKEIRVMEPVDHMGQREGW